MKASLTVPEPLGLKYRRVWLVLASSRAMPALTLPTWAQVVPASIVYQSSPMVVLTAVIAMPLTALASVSLMPPRKLLTRSPRPEPEGLAAFSSTAFMVSNVSARTGASFDRVTLNDLVRSAEVALCRSFSEMLKARLASVGFSELLLYLRPSRMASACACVKVALLALVIATDVVARLRTTARL